MKQPPTEEDVRACFEDFIQNRMPLKDGDNTMQFRNGFRQEGKMYRQRLIITVHVDEAQIPQNNGPYIQGLPSKESKCHP